MSTRSPRAPVAEPRRPARWAALAVVLAARGLPGGAVRDRYRQEFLAELYGMGRSRQAAHALGVLSRTWALRTALTDQVRLSKGEVMSSHVRRPVLCMLNVHHAWRTRSTEDGGRFRQCTRCGKDKNPRGRGPGDWAMGMGGGGIGAGG